VSRVYSIQLIAGTVTPGDSLEYLQTDTSTIVVRNIEVLAFADASSGAQLSLTSAGLTIWSLWWPASWISSESWEGRMVLPGPTDLTASIQGTDAFGEILVSGYVLTP
jgi:hypothetical protein